ncbi:sensor histidine kinase [Neptunitalea lumnitzerae]|uniref:histidine kinase n=1 Tax=Neptunitalea lumnitzerae TaxID=2965509 RepID=A0ABQ5MMC8_9FLAO|nr:HAMP domain-containing sensor histidine kinase [Neptunitalea sp. Y10]GLB50565.1 two-component sensor histidine kinase [Neptunitalea sp. Y10]
MSSRNKIKVLVVVCAIVLIGLVSIQYYLIHNTYNLQKKEYIAEVKAHVNPIVNAAVLDSLQDSLEESLKKLIVQRESGSLSKPDFKQTIRTKIDSIKQHGDAYIASELYQDSLLTGVALSFRYHQLYVSINGITDTILKTTEPPMVFFGAANTTKGFNLNNSNFYSTYSNDDVNVAYWGYYDVVFSAANWEQQVFYRMRWMLIAASSLLLAVVLLFYSMYKAILKERKVAEVKTDFANNITHELKTPITSIALITKSLKNEAFIADREKREELIATLERQHKRMQYITDRVLESVITEQVHKETVDVVTVLKNVCKDFDVKNHILRLDVPEELPKLQTDVYLLQRVLYNLLENAVKYSPEQSKISVSAYQHKSYCYIKVIDEGAGISLKEQKHIFDKFYRVPEGTRHGVKGLGLGLYLSKQLMQQLGGALAVTSEVGKGSVFTIKLPL